MDVTLELQGPPMPNNGNGMQGMVDPEDQFYYSYPRVSAQAILEKNGKKTELIGDFWYDHQWGVHRIPNKIKWCWMGFKLDNGENLNLQFMQDQDTSELLMWGLTRHHADGKTEFYKDVTFTPKGQWTSPHDLTYDVKWKVEVPEIKLVVDAEAYNNDHEVANMAGYIWEGPCKAKVTYADGSTTTGLGFLEMIGKPVAGSKK
jgi:predicted secreted hydrolase